MKKLTLFLAVNIMIMTISPIMTNAAGENYSVNIEESEFLSGVKQILFSTTDSGAISAKLDGTPVEGNEANETALYFSASGIDYANNSFYIGDNLLCKITKGLENEKADIDPDILTGDTLDIILLPSVGTSTLDTTKIYGEYNIDDMSITSIYLQLPMGEKFYPSKVIKGMPIQGSSGITEVEVDYTSHKIDIGDGWSSSTGLGGTTPNTPICATFRFDISQINLTTGNASIFNIDTTALADGVHIIEFNVGENKVKNLTFNVDNTPPTFVSNISFGQVITKGFTPSIIAVDANSVDNVVIRIDGEEYNNEPLNDLEYGKHTLTVVAADSCGNTASEAYQFIFTSNEGLISQNAVELSINGKIKLPFTNNIEPAKVELYTYTPINSITASVIENDEKKSYSFGNTTSTASTSNPAQYFDITVSNTKGAVRIEYSGVASENTDINIYANNKATGDWDLIGVSPSNSKTAVTISTPADYLNNGVIKIKAEPAYVISESDTFFWLSDSQYYSRFEDLYPTYETVMDYAIELYNQNKIGYFIHTGDVIDEVNLDDFARKQYITASKYQKMIEDANIPNGIVSGNHDIITQTADHSLFCEYFGADRYSSNQWYGGTLNNNTNHYDLITLGGYDFIFLYIGWGVEAYPETVAWANAVLKQYESRNAILCTHGYLGTDADWELDPANPYNYTHTRAVEIWENIVVPNENILAVFCGHVPGVARNKRQVEGTERYVWEILADYQYAETGDAPNNILNGETCDGEGYIRLVQFTDGKMSQTTYSPLHDDYNYYADDKDEFTIDFPLKETTHTLSTTSISAVCGFEKLETEINTVGDKYLTLEVNQSKSNGKIVLLAEDATGNKYEANIQPADTSTPQLGFILGAIAAVVAVTALIVVPFYKSRSKNPKK
ncbi:MAG: hypothetical protein A2Y17_08170 [Clostridiales bacterium GWF2_38_85]|nr:MAG: hypothetical protein A2Y17_08170 [Clostridiales bacterium GWF2_38_85]HBL83832.1 hypothetical protein [Clostridiales bacterium]